MIRKIFIFSILMLGLIGCEKKVEITTKEEKIKIVQGMFNSDSKMKEKYEKIKKELQLEADKGNKSAEDELKRWEEIKDEEIAKNMFKVSDKAKKIADEIRKSYNN